MSLLGLDVGIRGPKASRSIWKARRLPRPTANTLLSRSRVGELDEHVWRCVREVLGEVARRRRASIRAMAMSAQGEAVHAVAKDGACLTNSPVTFDGRTADLPAWWLERKSRMELAQISGMPLHGMYSLNKVLWFKQNQPDIFKRTWKFLCYEDFVQHRLGLDPIMSHSLAARTMALDVRKGDWSDELLGIAGVPREMLPRTAASGTVVGTIDDVVAERSACRVESSFQPADDQPRRARRGNPGKRGSCLTRARSTVFVRYIRPTPSPNRPSRATSVVTPVAFPGSTPRLPSTPGSLLKWYRDTFATEECRAAAESGRDVYEIAATAS